MQAEDLIPHVVKAARIVLVNPNNQESVEHFELVKKQWMDNMEKLRSMLDSTIDAAAFIRANGIQFILFALTVYSLVYLHVKLCYAYEVLIVCDVFRIISTTFLSLPEKQTL